MIPAIRVQIPARPTLRELSWQSVRLLIERSLVQTQHGAIGGGLLGNQKTLKHLKKSIDRRSENIFSPKYSHSKFPISQTIGVLWNTDSKHSLTANISPQY